MILRALSLTIVFAIAACARGEAGNELTPAETQAIRVEIETVLRDAYDITKPDVAERMLSLYPKTGRVISASGGRVLASRDTIEMGIRYFWSNVGSNMREPKWIWDTFHVDVLSPTAAVVTATYRIPHRNPRNEPHELGGAMTEVFAKRNGRWIIIHEHLSDLPQSSDSTAITPTHDRH